MIMNKTLLFCTSFAATNEQWEYRYKKWLDFYSKISLEKSQLLMIDDGSPMLPDWPNLKIYNEPIIPTEGNEKCVLFHFNNYSIEKNSLFLLIFHNLMSLGYFGAKLIE